MKVQGVGILAAIALTACSFDVEPSADLRDVDRAQVVQLSNFDFIPPSARHVYFFEMHFQDTQDVFYFQAPRQDIDAFAERLLGFVPKEPARFRNPIFDEKALKDWPRPPGEGGRSGRRNESAVGSRDVVIVDHPEYSEAWVEVWNWCPNCESADLSGKPPENRSTFREGSEMPPLLPPPPPRR